jgi:hypothetical protein
MKSYPLALDVENDKLRNHGFVGIYELGDKIAFIRVGFGTVSPEEYEKDKSTPQYVLSDMFSADFSEHRQTYLLYRTTSMFSASDAVCYWEDGRFLLNTKRYTGFISEYIAKIIEVRDTELVEIGDAPEPIQMIYSDGKTYTFGDLAVRMATQFMMECRSQTSGELVWKLKLSAYLYTEVEERNGILYFGTAGNGGRFYGVSAADGSVVFDYNTGGTVNFAWYKGDVLLSDKKGQPVLLNPRDGSEVRRLDFGKFKFTANHNMLIIDNRLYATVSGKDTMYAVCVDLDCER